VAERGFVAADRITCIVDRELAGRVEELLERQGVRGLLAQSGRAAVLRSRRWALNPRKGERLEEDPAELFRFYVPAGQDKPIVALLAREAGLDMPGRGSVFSERVQLWGLQPEALRPRRPEEEERPEPAVQSHLVYICCIVQRGEAAALALAVLQMGLTAPVVTFGTGMGLRDKLGLLRITIPADKEVLHVVVGRQDAQEAFDFMTDVARLHQPGRGFIYMSPLRCGVINTRIHRGEVRHVASIEQLITAVDTLTGDTRWRKKTTLPHVRRERGYLRDLMSYTILGAESRVEELVRAALDAGAGGATVSSLRAVGRQAEDGVYVPRARQASDLIVAASQVRSLHQAVQSRAFALDAPQARSAAEAGAAAPAEPGEVIELSEVEKASTYRHR